MNGFRFIWDERKNVLNQRKHGVSFEEARTAFDDLRSLNFFDPDHSGEEDRFILFGISARLRVLVVCHCYWGTGEVVRIISARKADAAERDRYLEG